MKLTINKLREEAIEFCKHESNITHNELIGITDGKAVGTYIEHKFEEYLKNNYEITIGSSARGIDLPDPHINTDIKVEEPHEYDGNKTEIFNLEDIQEALNKE